MKLLKLFITVTIFSTIFLFSCSDNGTNPEEKNIPEDVNEFRNAQEAGEFVKLSFNSIAASAKRAITTFTDNYNLKKLSANSDSLYYSNGWWYYTLTSNDSDSTTSMSINISDKCQFSKNGSVQQDWKTADKAHAIFSIDLDIISSGISTTSETKSDLTYSGLNSERLLINGGGSYDMHMTFGSMNKRYYLFYEFKSLDIPANNENLSGIVTMETKKYKITITFNGTNEAIIVVTKDGNTVYTTTYDINNYKK